MLEKYYYNLTGQLRIMMASNGGRRRISAASFYYTCSSMRQINKVKNKD
jgi:hypothetical protein